MAGGGRDGGDAAHTRNAHTLRSHSRQRRRASQAACASAGEHTASTASDVVMILFSSISLHGATTPPPRPSLDALVGSDETVRHTTAGRDGVRRGNHRQIRAAHSPFEHNPRPCSPPTRYLDRWPWSASIPRQHTHSRRNSPEMGFRFSPLAFSVICSWYSFVIVFGGSWAASERKGGKGRHDSVSHRRRSL